MTEAFTGHAHARVYDYHQPDRNSHRVGGYRTCVCHFHPSCRLGLSSRYSRRLSPGLGFFPRHFPSRPYVLQRSKTHGAVSWKEEGCIYALFLQLTQIFGGSCPLAIGNRVCINAAGVLSLLQESSCFRVCSRLERW